MYRIKRKLIHTFFREQWSLLVCDPAGTVLAPIAPPPDRFWADPFPVEYNGTTYIFIEEQIGSGNGRLGYIELYPDLSHSPFMPILEKAYHLSFPNVFCLEQENLKTWYMIPESSENKTIDLYRAEEFPGKWVFETTLLDGFAAVDSVVFQHDDYWWLFTGIETGSRQINKNLSAFYSKTFPSNKWKPHPLNPLVTGLGNSRMAGAVFTGKENGRPMRPAQNCLKDYGRETNINEIVELNTLSYKEKTVKTFVPEKEFRAVCTHTINYSPAYMLRDIKTRKWRFSA